HHRVHGNTIGPHTAHRPGSGRRSGGHGHGRVRRHFGAAAVPASLIAIDRERLIHPLHHPVDAEHTTIYVRGRGVMIEDIVARDQAYHGLTLQTMSATGMGRGYWKMFEPRVPGFVHAPTCHPYRCEDAQPGETAGQAAARALEETIVREGPDTIAAFVAEPIHGAGGVFYPTDDYWPLVREICTRYDVLLIDDEIITGFCRTGRWFALSHWNVTPDILC